MAWWSSFIGGSDKSFTGIKEDASEEMAGLNVKTAIEAHIKWKNRLKDVIDGTSAEVLDPQVVASDDQCALGKWLHGEGGKKFGSMPGFMPVMTAHAYFHKCAGKTLNLALEGKLKEADQELKSGDFARASMDVSLHLMRLWRDVGHH